MISVNIRGRKQKVAVTAVLVCMNTEKRGGGINEVSDTARNIISSSEVV